MMELSKLLTSCLTVVQKNLIRYCETTHKREAITFFWSIKNSKEDLDKLQKAK